MIEEPTATDRWPLARRGLGGARPRGATTGTRLLCLPCLRLWMALLSAASLVTGCATSPYERGRQALTSDPAAAARAFDQSIAAGSRVTDATRERGAARLQSGDTEGALSDLESARAMGDQSARLDWLLGNAYSKAGRYAEAATAYRSYEQFTGNRAVREATRERVAQLDHQVMAAAATSLREARMAGTQPPDNSVAVYAFQPAAGKQAPVDDQKICRALNVLVAADLAKVSALKTIAADQLDLIYREQRFTYENRQFFEPASLPAAGSLLPARHMVRGVYGSLPKEHLAMGAACYDALAGSSAQCSQQEGATSALFDMQTQLVLDVLKSLSVKPTAAELAAIGRKPTRNLRAFLAFSDGLYMRDTGDPQGAQKAFEKAATIDPGFTLASEAAAATAVDIAGADVVIDVPPPVESSAAQERAMSSALQLGLGLIPDLASGDGTAGTVEEVVSARGEATLHITARVGGQQP